MPDLFRLNTDRTLLGADGKAVANGQVHFYDHQHHRYAPVYGDPGRQVPLRQPVQADGDGVLPPIYLDDCTEYRVVIADAQNNRLRESTDIQRISEGMRVLDSLEALKAYCGDDTLVLVADPQGCPNFYRRLQGCGTMPEEHLPDIVHTHRCAVWQRCRNEPELCAQDTAELNCDFQVLVQECPTRTDGGPQGCGCGGTTTQTAKPALKKASIGALIGAASRCLPQVCIPHDAPELALVGNTLAYGEREPPPVQVGVLSGSFSACIAVALGAQADAVSRHIRLDSLRDLAGVPVYYPKITLTNSGPCKRRYELRALNRLNRANENPSSGASFGEVPLLNANFQTRLGMESDLLIDAVLGVADYALNLPWMTSLSIADSAMGPFRSGTLFDAPLDNHPFASANGYTENTLIVDLDPGVTATYALKYHIYWDMNARPEALSQALERIHFGTRLMARQIR